MRENRQQSYQSEIVRTYCPIGVGSMPLFRRKVWRKCKVPTNDGARSLETMTTLDWLLSSIPIHAVDDFRCSYYDRLNRFDYYVIRAINARGRCVCHLDPFANLTRSYNKSFITARGRSRFYSLISTKKIYVDIFVKEKKRM